MPRNVLHRVLIEITDDNSASLTEAGAERLADVLSVAVEGGDLAHIVLDALIARGLPEGVDEAIQVHVMDLAS